MNTLNSLKILEKFLIQIKKFKESTLEKEENFPFFPILVIATNLKNSEMNLNLAEFQNVAKLCNLDDKELKEFPVWHQVLSPKEFEKVDKTFHDLISRARNYKKMIEAGQKKKSLQMSISIQKVDKRSRSFSDMFSPKTPVSE
jgi:hypothetical protein